MISNQVESTQMINLIDFMINSVGVELGREECESRIRQFGGKNAYPGMTARLWTISTEKGEERIKLGTWSPAALQAFLTKEKTKVRGSGLKRNRKSDGTTQKPDVKRSFWMMFLMCLVFGRISLQC